MSAQPHIVNGEFQSDKYPNCPRGKVPLSVKDPTAQDLLWEYAQRRRAVEVLTAAREETQQLLDRIGVFDISNSTVHELLAVIRTLCDTMIDEGMADL